MAKSASHVDVLIIGAGPAGLFMATQLSKLKMDVRIIDRAAHPVLRGHADGLQCRTGEVFHALGIGSRIEDEACECAEVVTYTEKESGGIVETARQPDTVPGTSQSRHVLLGQDRVEAIFLDAMKENNNVTVDRLLAPVNLEVHESELSDPNAYPFEILLKHLPPPAAPEDEEALKSGLYRSNLFAQEDSLNGINGHATLETVKCKYLVGCDGARSWVRKQLGIQMRGDSANTYWGCFDAAVKTDLPTIRMKNHVNLRHGEGVRMIPRERGLVRIYTQMGSTVPGERVNRADVTIEKLCARTAESLKPYKVEFPRVECEVGQRVSDNFAAYQNRVFITGDACHTHSPRAGQGMNVSMMDAWNLGWKIASVLKGRAKPDILATYEAERRAVAKGLIDMHHNWSSISAAMAAKTNDPDQAADLARQFTEAAKKAAKFVSGTAVVYGPSMLVKSTSTEASKLAKNVIIGSHFPDFQVVCVADAHAVRLQRRLVGNGRWRIIIFAGDIRHSSCSTAFQDLASYLNSAKSPIRRYTPKGSDLDSVIECLTVLATPRDQIQSQYLTWPEVLMPERSPDMIRAYDTIFADVESYHTGHGHAYEGYGIDPATGCVVIIRPDQHVATVLSLQDASGISRFFDDFMIPAI